MISTSALKINELDTCELVVSSGSDANPKDIRSELREFGQVNVVCILELLASIFASLAALLTWGVHNPIYHEKRLQVVILVACRQYFIDG